MVNRSVLAAFVLAVSACTNESNDTRATEEAAADAAAAATAAASYAASAAAQTYPVPDATLPPSPTHNYDARDGVIYSYIAAISDDDRKAGKAAGDVVSFAYLGKRKGKHVLAHVNNEGTVLDYSNCAQPCRIITYRDGRQVAYNEESIIGAVFADAIAGRLRLATIDYGQGGIAKRFVPPAPSPRPSTEEVQPSDLPSGSASDQPVLPSEEPSAFP